MTPTESPPAGMTPDWPAPCSVLCPAGGSDWLLICEHASRHMPAEYADLGLAEPARSEHIAWDIGAAALTRALSARLDATAALANYSRLLIDLNRPLGAPSAIPERSEVHDIPGNRGLDAAARERREARIFRPFHAEVAALIDARKAAGRRTRLLAVHSFTPVFAGVARPWQMGVLAGASRGLAIRLVAEAATDPALCIALDEPYQVAADEDYAIPVHGDARGLDALLLEIRNDELRDPAGVAAWAGRLAGWLAAL